ncbi:MAG: hypothetical protein D6772_04875 [Bacteroidetes bacterium]|nr:MAG: hypothetical protein D6772_04875 [Bacteroidota bacterium]
MTILPGKTFGHYQIQMMPSLALLAATFFHPDRQSMAAFRRAFQGVAASGTRIFLILFLLVLPLSLWWYYHRKPDYPRIVAQRVAPWLGPQDQLYTGNYHQIVYHLLDQDVPTPYVHSSLLFYNHHVRALQIDLAKEADRLLNRAQLPAVVLLREEHPDNELTRAIHQRYIVRDTLPDHVLLLTPK